MELRLRAARADADSATDAVEGVGEVVDELADEVVEISSVAAEDIGVSFETSFSASGQ